MGEATKFQFALGKYAKDRVTGFKGIITARIEYMYGCHQYSLTPSVNSEGKTQDNCWFDEGRIEIIGQGLVPESVQAEREGAGDDARTLVRG